MDQILSQILHLHNITNIISNVLIQELLVTWLIRKLSMLYAVRWIITFFTTTRHGSYPESLESFKTHAKILKYNLIFSSNL